MASKWLTVIEGVGGATAMAFHLLCPWRREWRSQWGATGDECAKPLPGDYLPISAPDPGGMIHSTWLFLLAQDGSAATRLIVRGMYDFPPTLFNKILMGKHVLEPIALVMERKMLWGIKL